MTEKELLPDHRQVFSDYLMQADETNSVGIIGQALINLCNTFQINPLPMAEEILREKGSQTYLLAMPISPNEEYTAKLPHRKDKEYPYYLWVCLHGRQEAEEMMARIETNPEQNLKDLAETGMPCVKANSQLSRMSKAPLN